MGTINLSKVLPLSLKTQFWIDFHDVWSEELELFRNQIAEKKIFFNVREQNDNNQLLEIYILMDDPSNRRTCCRYNSNPSMVRFKKFNKF